MDENQNQQESTQSQKSNLNPLLIVVILIIVAAVGVMLWLGSNKTGTQSMTDQVVPTTTTQTEQQPEATGSATDEEVMQQAITVEGGEFYFKPNEIRVKQGEKVTITLNNAGKMPHDFVIDEFNVQSQQITGGQTTTVTFTPDKKGSFEFYCSVGTHRQMGMKGTLIVE